MKPLHTYILGCLLLLIGQHAAALTITPSDYFASGPETSTSAIRVIVAGLTGSAPELYKAEVPNNSGDPIVEEGPLAGSYMTEFFNSSTDPADADIIYSGGDIVTCPECWAVVKDGNHDPGWYLFDLDALGWDGMETLYFRDFWPNGGAISHIALLGERGEVPEPGPLALLAIGLIALSLRQHKKAC